MTEIKDGLNSYSNLKKKLGKLFKKDRKRYEIVMKKMEEILQNPHHLTFRRYLKFFNNFY